MAGAFHRSCRRQMGHYFSFPALQYIFAGASSVAQFTRSKTLEIKTVALRISMVGSRGESHSSPSELLCGTVLQDCTYRTQSRGDIHLGTPGRPWPYPLRPRVTCQYLANDRSPQFGQDYTGHHLGDLSVSFWSRFTETNKIYFKQRFSTAIFRFCKFQCRRHICGSFATTVRAPFSCEEIDWRT